MVHAAIGYARANDLLSTLACSASIGPGSTNLLTGAATATVNRVPVLLLPSDTFANRRRGPVMQALEHALEADLTVNDAFRPAERVLRPHHAARAARDVAARGDAGAARSRRDRRRDALPAPGRAGRGVRLPGRLFEPRTWHVARRPPAESRAARGGRGDARRRAAARDRRRRRALLRRAGRACASCRTRCGIPVAETSAGKGALPAGELAMGGVGVTGTRAANALAREADLVLCVGTRLIDLTTGSHSLFQDPDVRFVGRQRRRARRPQARCAAVVADAKLGAARRCSMRSQRGLARARCVARARARGAGRWERELSDDLAPRDGERMSQGQVLRALNEASTARRLARGGIRHSACGCPQALGRLGRRTLPDGGGLLLHGGRDPGRARRPDGATGGRRGLRPDRRRQLPDGRHRRARDRAAGGPEAHRDRGRERRLSSRSTGSSARGPAEASGSSSASARRTARASAGPSSTSTTPRTRAVSAAPCSWPRRSTSSAPRSTRARARRGRSVIVARVEPRRLMLDSDCWWDVGVAELSERARDARAGGRARSRPARFSGHYLLRRCGSSPPPRFRRSLARRSRRSARSRSRRRHGARARRRRGPDRARHAPRRRAARERAAACGRSRAPARATTTSTSRRPPGRACRSSTRPGSAAGRWPRARRPDPRRGEALRELGAIVHESGWAIALRGDGARPRGRVPRGDRATARSAARSHALCSALGMRVIAHDPGGRTRVRRSSSWSRSPELLARADVITLHCALTERTRGLVDRSVPGAA